ncbi:MAG: ATP-binding protein [Bacteroidota bacterium]
MFDQQKIEVIKKLILEAARGNYDYKIPGAGDGTADELDDILTGIYMLVEQLKGINNLAQELKRTTVSRDYMDSICRGVVDILFVLNSDMAVQDSNQAATRILLFPKRELLNNPIYNFLTNDSAVLLQNAMTHLQHTYRSNVYLQFYDRQQNIIPTSCTISVLTGDDQKESGVLLIAKDITQLKKAEEDLIRAKEKAETANKAKSVFLATMSHEIRTPLNGIIGMTGLLSQTTLTPEQRQFCDIIVNCSENLLTIINDILDFSKIESSKFEIEHKEFDLRNCVEDVLKSVAPRIFEKGLQLKCGIKEDVPINITGDCARLKQVLANLVGNAIKFTDKGEIAVNAAMKANKNDSPEVEFKVTDTGIGIPADKMEFLFKAFSQIDSFTTRKQGGMGLGLAICKKLVGLMGGTIGVESVPGKGTTFWFTVAATKGKEQFRSALGA